MEVSRHWRRILGDKTYNVVFGTCLRCEGDIFPITRPICPHCGGDNRTIGMLPNVNAKGGVYYATTKIEKPHECPEGTEKPERIRVDLEELVLG